jgi:prepilin peptidase CpaA
VATAFAAGLIWALSLAGLLAGAVSDFRRRIIPNRLVALTAGCGLLLRLLADPRSIGLSIAVALALMLLMGVMARRQWLGGGDVKMIAAATLLVPAGEVGVLLLYIVICGGLLSCAYLVVHTASRQSGLVTAGVGATPVLVPPPDGLLSTGIQEIASSPTLPYGVAIFLGTTSFALKQAAWWFYATS